MTQLEEENRAKEQVILHVNKLPLYFLCYFLVDIFTRSLDDFISMKFLIAVFLPASPFLPTSPFIDFGDFCQPSRFLHLPGLLFWPKFASLPVYFSLPFYLKLESRKEQLIQPVHLSFLQETLISIKRRHFHSSINHQEDPIHRALYHQLLSSYEYCKVLKNSFFIEHLQKQTFADVLRNRCS